MPSFTYTARDRSGRRVRGTVAAVGRREAAARVRGLGFERARVRLSGLLTRVLTAARRLCGEYVGPAVSGVPLPDLLVFYRQLATLVDAGISPAQALANLQTQARHPRLKALAAGAAAHTLAGGRLSDALAAHRDVLGDLQIEIVRAAERGGMLGEMLGHIAGYLEQELETRRLVSRLTLYPKLLAVAALLIVGKSFLLSLGGAFPAISGLVLTGDLWEYLKETLFFLAELLLLGYGAAAVCRLALLRSEAARRRYEAVKWSLPGLGGCVRKFAFAKFGRAFQSPPSMENSRSPVSGPMASKYPACEPLNLTVSVAPGWSLASTWRNRSTGLC